MQPKPDCFRRVTPDVDELVTLGHIGAAHGIKGWCRIISHTQPRDGIARYNRWLIRHTDDAQWLEVTPLVVRQQGKYLVAQLEGSEDRNRAEWLRGAEIAVPRSEFEALPAGDYYWHQLEGLKVVTAAGAICLGWVDHLIETGANDVLVVKPGEGSIDDRERLIPYLWERVVKAVDLDAQLIQVDWEQDY